MKKPDDFYKACIPGKTRASASQEKLSGVQLCKPNALYSHSCFSSKIVKNGKGFKLEIHEMIP